MVLLSPPYSRWSNSNPLRPSPRPVDRRRPTHKYPAPSTPRAHRYYGSASKRRKSSRPPLFHRRHGGPQARGCPNPTLGHGAAQRARRRPRETQSVFAMPAYGRAGRRHRSTSVEDHPNASGHRDPLRGEQHFPADLSGWPSAPEGSRLQMDGLFRSDGGKAIRLLSTAADSGITVGSTVWAIHTAPICT